MSSYAECQDSIARQPETSTTKHCAVPSVKYSYNKPLDKSTLPDCLKRHQMLMENGYVCKDTWKTVGTTENTKENELAII
jgi:hypothetical protein